MKKSNDISTIYTKELNKKCGRKGYYMFKKEKVTVIPPNKYGMMILSRKRRGINK